MRIYKVKTKFKKDCFLNLAVRFALAYSLSLGLFFLIKSDAVAKVMDHSFIGPEGLNNFPLILLGVLLGAFLFFYRHSFKKEHLKIPSAAHFIIALFLLMAAIWFAFFMTHPSLKLFTFSQAFIKNQPVIGGPTVAAILYSVLITPFPFLFALFLPASFLCSFRKPLAGIFLLVLLYIFSNVLEAEYHHVSVPYTIYLVGKILSVFPGESMVNVSGYRLAYQNFHVVVGPVCSGLTMLSLFAGFFAFIWLKLSKAPAFSHFKAFVAFLIGLVLLFFANALRIVLIMMVGTFSPRTATEMFHSSIGAIMVFAVFMIYLKYIVPRLMRKN